MKNTIGQDSPEVVTLTLTTTWSCIEKKAPLYFSSFFIIIWKHHRLYVAPKKRLRAFSVDAKHFSFPLFPYCTSFTSQGDSKAERLSLKLKTVIIETGSERVAAEIPLSHAMTACDLGHKPSASYTQVNHLCWCHLCCLLLIIMITRPVCSTMACH